MKELKDALWADYNSNGSQLESCSTENTLYKLLLEDRDKIRNDLIKLEELQIESDLKKYQTQTENETKSIQLKAESKREMLRNLVNIGIFVVSTSVSLFALNKTFKFDEDATVTSSMGKNIINGFVPKMFRR